MKLLLAMLCAVAFSLPAHALVIVSGVWDATATSEETGRKLALFRCTQLILHPR